MIDAFVEHGTLPEQAKYRLWIVNYLLVGKGFSRKALYEEEDMEIEEYEFVKYLMFRLAETGKEGGFKGI